MEPRFVLGCVPYLNAKPLSTWFHTSAGELEAQVRYAAPSVLAQWLRDREVQVALVSSIEAFRRPDSRIVPGIAIASEGEVLSVRLFSKVPFPQIRSVALDTSALTSSALVQVVLSEQFAIRPLYQRMAPNLEQMLNACDAGLLIGDKGMKAETKGLYVLDLGAAWHTLTGLPFVWAIWLANEEHFTQELVELLHKAKAYGVANLDPIIVQESDRLGVPPALCDRYLRQLIGYDLTPRYEEGLQQFAEKCRQHRLL